MKKFTLDEAIEDQTKLKTLINKLNNNYNLKNMKKAEEKKRVSESARKLSDARDEIINLFKKGTLPYKGNVFKTKEKEESEEKSEELDEESDKELDENKFLNILRMNQRVLTMSYLKHILDIQYLLFWQKHYLKQKVKRKTMT